MDAREREREKSSQPDLISVVREVGEVVGGCGWK